ncbi:MAG: sugar phosphate isomerase/epimerase [Planctomycetales bacterium]|nr:sugar phosphate isomerase/epimerase [Planctomycetales bacterium]
MNEYLMRSSAHGDSTNRAEVKDRGASVFVAASTECFPELSLVDSIERLGDLEYSAIEIAINEWGQQLKPSQVLDQLEAATAMCRDTHRMDIAGFFVRINATGDEFYRQFQACSRMAKAAKVVSITVPSAELGTPFNEEVEHLRRLVDIATVDGVLVSIKTEVGRLSQDPDTIQVMCDNVKGLGVTLDPSHYIYQAPSNRGYDQLLKYVYSVHLRDTTKDTLQVRVGQGEVEYSKLITQLRRFDYRRGLVVDMAAIEGVDHNSEMRKIRLLLESLL